MKSAVEQAANLFAQIDFSLDELRYQYPEDPVFEELGNRPLPSQQALERLTAIGLKKRYPKGAPQKVIDAIAHETRLIAKLDYAPYFLTVYDIVRFARSKGILCQGRGSAANSSICFCLGITEVDPGKVSLLFERFISEERNEPPDIDVDFEHERREEVIQYIYAKYGRDKAGLAATVISYRSRSALREVGKVFGLSDDAVTAISGTKWGSYSREIEPEDARRAGLDPSDKYLKQMLDLASQIIGFPRHLSQHVGGFVISRDRLSSLIPIENAAMQDRTIVEWDKDDLESLGMLKIDVLALGMLTCIRKAFSFLQSHYGRTETLSSLPDEDEATYDMICRADTIGVFQIESRAQMSMLPRLKPRCLLRPRHRGCHRATGAHSGRHGASLSATAPGQGAGQFSQGGTGGRAGQDAGCAAVSGAGHEHCHRGCKILPRRSRQAAPRHGDFQACRHHQFISAQDGRGHGVERL